MVAGRLAADLDAKVTAVYVRELPVVVATPYAAGIDLDRYWRGLELSVSRRTAEVLDGLGVACRLEVLVGDPAVELERAAGEHGADLIVVGTRGHSLAHRLLRGSVSTRLVHHARRPVLVVR